MAQVEVDKPLGLKFQESNAPGGGLKVTVRCITCSLMPCFAMIWRAYVHAP